MKRLCVVAGAVSLSACVTSPLPSQSQSQSQSQSDTVLVDTVRNLMEVETEAGFSGIVFVARGENILFHEAFGVADRKSNRPMTRDAIISSGSLSKQITATAIVQLAEQGRLSLDDQLSEYFQGIPSDKAGITLRQLLSHTSGLASWVFPDDFTPISREDWLRMVFETPLAQPAGSGYLYSNDGYSLAAMVVEHVTGTDYQTYIRQTYFQPLEMEHAGWFGEARFNDDNVNVATGYMNEKDDGSPDEWPAPNWALLGNGGVIWSASDMFSWHRAVHGRLLSPGSRQLLFSPVTEASETSNYSGERLPNFYALGWNIGTTVCGGTRIGHTGTGVSHNIDYRFYRDRDLLVYVASNKLETAYTGEELRYSQRAANAIADHLMSGCAEGTER